MELFEEATPPPTRSRGASCRVYLHMCIKAAGPCRLNQERIA